MKKGNIILIIVVIVALIILWGVSSYNSLISAEENVSNQYSNIEVQLERRADLIPSLVNTVKGYVSHEEAIIKEITEARQAISKADNIKELSTANNQLTSALNSLNLIVENYPDLKANQNFISLQDELAGTENRIAIARRDYNEAVKKYNAKIKKIPTNLIASLSGLEKADYFKAADSKLETPKVDFE